MTQPAISLDSAVLLATVSRRTLWRRVQDGQIGRSGTDERGRALLALADLGPLLCIRLDDEGDASLLVEADRGSAVAQNELGILCLEQAQGPVALHWFKLAAEQGHSDAMHHLSRLYLHGIEHSGGGLLWPCPGPQPGLSMAIQGGRAWPCNRPRAAGGVDRGLIAG